MKRKRLLVLDVETANSTDDPFVYDLGGVVCDQKGNIYETFSFVIKDIFDGEPTLMDTAYYANKVPLYREGLRDSKFRKVSFYDARSHVLDVIKRNNIKEVYAYNADFDRKALNTTQRWLTKSKYRWFFPYGVEVKCIWHMACQTICLQKGYRRFCEDNGFRTEKNNRIKTSAEAVYAYMNQRGGFEEKHMGLEDSLIEVDILAHCIRQHKKMDRNINRLCWKIPQG